jgi:hypothetical protein
MNRFFTAVFFVLASSLLSSSVVAQSHNHTEPLPSFPPHPPYPPLVLPDAPRSSTFNRSHVAREERVLKKGLLAPSAGDRLALAAFLKTRNTGLIRLLPREVYDSRTHRPPKKLNIRGGGAYYSFAHLTHAYGYGSDIELDQNRLSVGFAGADYGMLTNLGDTPLEEITLDDMRTRQIAAYRPARSEPKAREEFRLFSGKGMMFDGFLYRKTVPAQERSTYLLRSIAFENSDVLVAFRLIRKDPDGSAIIAWKLLKRYATPSLR